MPAICDNNKKNCVDRAYLMFKNNKQLTMSAFYTKVKNKMTK